MKKTFVILVAMMMSVATAQVQAQSFGSLLKDAASSAASKVKGNSSSSSGTGLSELVSGLLGSKTVSSSSMVGTWTYTEPAIVFASDNILTNTAAKVVASQAQSKFQASLNKIGFTKGKVVLTLKDGGTGTLKVTGKSFTISWSVSGTDLKINLGSALSATAQKSFTFNVNQSGKTLQLSMKADKVLALTKSVCAGASSVSSSLTTVNTLLKSVNGLYLGLQFTK